MAAIVAAPSRHPAAPASAASGGTSQRGRASSIAQASRTNAPPTATRSITCTAEPRSPTSASTITVFAVKPTPAATQAHGDQLAVGGVSRDAA